MDKRDRDLFAKVAQVAANEAVVKQLRGLPGLGVLSAGMDVQEGTIGGEIIVDEVEQSEPTEKQREIILCQSALRNLIQSLHELATAGAPDESIFCPQVSVSHLVFREPNWRGLLKYMCDSNPGFAGDPNVLKGSFLGIKVLANWDPQEDEVLVLRGFANEHEVDPLPAIILKPAGLSAFAAYWRAHGGSQK